MILTIPTVICQILIKSKSSGRVFVRLTCLCGSALLNLASQHQTALMVVPCAISLRSSWPMAHGVSILICKQRLCYVRFGLCFSTAIRIGNRLYDRCRHSLSQCYLSVSEAATITAVESPLPVCVCDEHAPTTLLYQLKELCQGGQSDAALVIANEKTVLFMLVMKSYIIFILFVRTFF